jgi:hypothetical protein
MRGRFYWQMTDRVKVSSQEPNMVVINEVHAETSSGCVGVAGLACAYAHARHREGPARPERTLSIACATKDERLLHLLELVKAKSHVVVRGGD